MPAGSVAYPERFRRCFGGTEPESPCQLALALEFMERASGYAEKWLELTISSSPGAFGDIGHDRNGSTTHLCRDAESLGSRKVLRQLIDGYRQVLAGMPCIQIPVIAHTAE
ncbi:MAG TPA: hypothetical protein VFM12_03330 [Gemmatimonadales bacterium]|nr:hypothetical protein [Gemmatimonadales bacterium]